MLQFPGDATAGRGSSVIPTIWRPRSRPGGARDLRGQLDLVADQADEPEQHQHPDHDPRGVELQAAHAELGAGRIRVVVVVQALATGEPREYSEVGGGVGEEVLATGPV